MFKMFKMFIKIHKYMIIFFPYLFMAMSANCYSQINQDQDVQQHIKEIMKMRDQMVKSLFDDSDSQNFDKQFNDLAQKFEKEAFSLDDQGDAGPIIGEYDWREDPKNQIFSLKVKQIKNKPLDIKIEKGQIHLRGDVESVDLKNKKSKKITKVHFERIFSIPEGVDQTRPVFESREGELLIKFKKLKMAKILPPDKHIPLKKGDDDLTL